MNIVWQVMNTGYGDHVNLPCWIELASTRDVPAHLYTCTYESSNGGHSGPIAPHYYLWTPIPGIIDPPLHLDVYLENSLI